MCHSREFAMLLHTAGKWDGSAWRRETVFLLAHTLDSSKGSAPFSEDLPWLPPPLAAFFSVLPIPWGGGMGSRRLGGDGALDEGFPLGPSQPVSRILGAQISLCHSLDAQMSSPPSEPQES